MTSRQAYSFAPRKRDFSFLNVFCFLFLSVLWFGPAGASAASRSVVLSGRTLAGSTALVTCSLSAAVAAKSGQIQIGRAYNSPNYTVIAGTRRRVRRLAVRTKLSSPGTYYFLCRVTLKGGKIVWSNRLTATVGQPAPTPTALPTAAPTQAPEIRSCPSNYAASVISLVNQARGGNGLSSLQNNSQLQTAAQGHTEWMARAQNLTHGTVEEMVSRIRAAGFTGSPVGENIASGQTSPAQVMNSWLNSAPHRANILDSRFNYIGVGCIIDRYGAYWWTQNFGG